MAPDTGTRITLDGNLPGDDGSRVRCTLVTGPTAAAREAIIAASLRPGEPTCVLLEGIPDGLDRLAKAEHPELLEVTRIAPGCICCTGNLPMRVSLDRLLRRQPRRLFVALASTEHFDAILAFLQAPPYNAHLFVDPSLLSA